jgi:CheY-like chemotaxis protein
MSINEKPCILIVDDTPANLDVLKGLLSDSYKVKAANSGMKCIKIANHKPIPDLILLDIMMPEMNGYEVCQKLKEDPFTKNIPIIFVTAKSSIEDEIKGFSLGAVDYMTKPISPPLLEARVKTHLQLHNNAILLEELVNKQTQVLNSKVKELEILSALQHLENDSLSLEEAQQKLLYCYQQLFSIEQCAFIFPETIQGNATLSQQAPELNSDELEALPNIPTTEHDENSTTHEFSLALKDEGKSLAHLWYIPKKGAHFNEHKIDRYCHLAINILKSAFLRKNIEEGCELDADFSFEL